MKMFVVSPSGGSSYVLCLHRATNFRLMKAELRTLSQKLLLLDSLEEEVPAPLLQSKPDNLVAFRVKRDSRFNLDDRECGFIHCRSCERTLASQLAHQFSV